MPSPNPPFKTILELVLWNGLQSCHSITPDVISVIKMPSFQYFLYLREQKNSRWGLDSVLVEIKYVYGSRNTTVFAKLSQLHVSALIG
jgi:hypothetical protein